MSHPILKIVNSEGCNCYLIACPETRACLLVDPKVGSEALVTNLIEQYALKLSAVLDTHTHADHLSAATRFCGPGIPLWMSQATSVERTMEKLSHGQNVSVGNLSFRVIEVAGHTPDSVALYGEGMLISGDSLFIGGLARADFEGSDAAQMYDLIQERLMSLPGETLVFPGHGYNDISFSTIDCERRLNESLGKAGGAEYADGLDITAGAGNSAAVNSNLKLNLEANPELPKAAGNAAACCASPGGNVKVNIKEIAPSEALGIRDSLTGPEQWVDVRDPFEFGNGRIPGTTSIPLSELGFHLERLRSSAPLYLSCRSGVRSITAAKTLQRLGVVTQPVSIGGGILGWQEQGFPIEGLPAT